MHLPVLQEGVDEREPCVGVGPSGGTVRGGASTKCLSQWSRVAKGSLVAMFFCNLLLGFSVKWLMSYTLG